jgi:putative transposase of IS4/5 family DUF4096
VNAIFDTMRTGCPWRVLPEVFSPWQTVYRWFPAFRGSVLFERINHGLVMADWEHRFPSRRCRSTGSSDGSKSGNSVSVMPIPHFAEKRPVKTPGSLVCKSSGRRLRRNDVRRLAEGGRRLSAALGDHRRVRGFWQRQLGLS